jgi:hypothetical protein
MAGLSLLFNSSWGPQSGLVADLIRTLRVSGAPRGRTLCGPFDLRAPAHCAGVRLVIVFEELADVSLPESRAVYDAGV